MKIYHIIKKSGEDTDFRSVMLHMLQRIQSLKNEHHDQLNIKIYLASGFFNVNVAPPKTDVLNYIDPISKATLLKLLSGLNVEILGAYSGSKDLMSLKALLSPIAKTLKVYYKYRFHTKLFVITINNIPVFEIIGSSNMTIPAYEGLQYSSKGISSLSLNTETDLILYNDEFSLNGLDNVLGNNIRVERNVMRFEYVDEKNDNITFVDRMKDIVNYLETLKTKMKSL